MLRLHLRTFLATSLRLWQVGAAVPSPVGYGALLLFLALFAGVVVTLADAIAIISRLWHILKS